MCDSSGVSFYRNEYPLLNGMLLLLLMILHVCLLGTVCIGAAFLMLTGRCAGPIFQINGGFILISSLDMGIGSWGMSYPWLMSAAGVALFSRVV